MKNIFRFIALLMLMSIASKSYAQNWIPYQEVIPPVTQTQIIYVHQPQSFVIYQWVPYTSHQNIIVEQQRIFCRTQTIVNKPFTQWVLQPVVIYR